MRIPRYGLYCLMLLPLMAYADSINEDGSATVTFPVQIVTRCVNGGGCVLLTEAEIYRIKQEAIREACSTAI